jgi:hypothetical protein
LGSKYYSKNPNPYPNPKKKFVDPKPKKMSLNPKHWLEVAMWPMKVLNFGLRLKSLSSSPLFNIVQSNFRSLVREVLACSLLQPLLHFFSHPDRLNQTIVWLLRDCEVTTGTVYTTGTGMSKLHENTKASLMPRS